MQKPVFSYCIEKLKPRYGGQEAESLTSILLEDAFSLHKSSTEAFNEKDRPMLEHYLSRLVDGEPLQYILGEADFLGLKIGVTPAVLIPRMETEELADWVQKTIKNEKPAARILDIGTGSACIPIYIKKKCLEARVEACDISEEALEIALKNADRYQLPIDFHVVDILDEELWSVLPNYDIIISNPPYIPPSEKKHIPEHVLAYEPELALFAPESNPLLFYDTIADFSRQKLNNTGLLFFECNEFNAHTVEALLKRKGFQEVELRKDIMGKKRMIKAVLFKK